MDLGLRMAPERPHLKYFRKLLKGNDQEVEPDLEGMRKVLQTFRGSLLAATEKPDRFWEKQRSGILRQIDAPVSPVNYRPSLIWGSAALVAILCLTLFVESSKAPTPDFAAGYDQDLLIEVERALNQKYADAMAPAESVSWGIEGPDANRGDTSFIK